MVKQDNSIQKVTTIFDLLKNWRSAGGDKSIYLDFKYPTISKPFLKDWANTEEVFNLIEETTNGDVSFSVRRTIWRHSDKADQPNNNPTLRPVGVEIKIKDKKKLEEYFNQVFKKLGVKNFSQDQIELIEVIRLDEEQKITLIINKKLDNPIKVSVKKGNWKIFLEIIESGPAEYQNAKHVFDYFNSSKLCPLYSRTNYLPTPILTKNDRELSIAKNIKIKIKGPKTIARRKNKRA